MVTAVDGIDVIFMVVVVEGNAMILTVVVAAAAAVVVDASVSGSRLAHESDDADVEERHEQEWNPKLEQMFDHNSVKHDVEVVETHRRLFRFAVKKEN